MEVHGASLGERVGAGWIKHGKGNRLQDEADLDSRFHLRESGELKALLSPSLLLSLVYRNSLEDPAAHCGVKDLVAMYLPMHKGSYLGWCQCHSRAAGQPEGGFGSSGRQSPKGLRGRP